MNLASAEARPSTQEHERYRWVILAVGVVSQLGASFAGQGIPTLGYFFQREWSLSRAEVGMFASSIYLLSMLSVAAFGVVADIVGIRLLLLIGQVASGSFVVLMGFSNSFLMALLVLLPAGLGTSMVNPAISKALMYWFPPRLLGTAMGVKQTGVPLGGASAAIALPALAIAFNWRVAVVAFGLTIIACGVTSYLLYREAPQTGKLASSSPRPTLRQVLSTLGRREILTVSLLQMPLCAVQFGVGTYLLLYLNEVLLFPVLVGAMVLSVTQISGAGSRILWGLASDRVFGGSRRKTMLVILGMGILVMASTAALPVDTPVWLVIALGVLLGAIVFGWPGVYFAQVGEMANKHLVATVFGIAYTAGQFGIVLGPPFFGYVVDHTGSYRVAWLIMAGCFVVSALLAFSLREGRRAGTIDDAS